MTQQRTEEPTPKRLLEARRRGEVPQSRDLTGAAVLLAFAGALWLMGPHLLDAFRQLFARTLDAVQRPARADLVQVLYEGVGLFAEALWPLGVVMLVVGVAVSLLQVGPLFAFGAVAARPSRVDPAQGLARLLSGRSAFELLKSVLLLVVIGCVAFVLLRAELRGIVGLAAGEPERLLRAMASLVMGLVVAGGVVLLAWSALDLIYQRHRHRLDLRMTLQEVRRERREAESDPRAAAHRKRAHDEILAQVTREDTGRHRGASD